MTYCYWCGFLLSVCVCVLACVCSGGGYGELVRVSAGVYMVSKQ